MSNWTDAQVEAHQKRVRSGPKRDSAGIVLAKAVNTRPVKKKAPNPLERARVLEILQWLQANRPKFCWVRVEPSSAVRARAYAGQPDKARKFPEDAWGDGVADILGIGVRGDGGEPGKSVGYFLYSIAIEVKRPGQYQRDSQVAFEVRWKAAGGLYMVANDSKQVEEQFRVWGI